MLLETILLATAFACSYIVWKHLNSKGIPPGPIKIPLLGTLVQIGLADKEGYLGMHKLSKKYGDVMSLKMGFLDVVVLSSYEAIKEVFSKEETLGRHCEGIWWDRCMKQNAAIFHPNKHQCFSVSLNLEGIVFSNGKTWEVIRQFCKDTLRDYGFGNRSAMEQLIHEEIGHLLKFMEEDSESNGGKIRFSSCYFQFAFANSLASMLTGSRHAYEDVEIQKLLKDSKEYVESGVVASGILTAFPFLRFIFPEALGYNTQMRALDGINVYAKDTILITNVHTIFFDEAFWGDPHTFRPDRFLDDKNNLIPNKVERISVAFGSGRRSCFGEVLARDSSFLFLTALIQKFSFQLLENQKKPRLDPLVGFTLGPFPYEAIVCRR